MSSLSRSTHAKYITPHDSPTTEGQTSFLNGLLLLPSETFVERHSGNFLDVDGLRCHVNSGVMREPYHRPQKMVPKHDIQISPYSDNGTFQYFAELGSGGGELGAPQSHMPHSVTVSMDTLGPTDAISPLKTFMYSSAIEPVKHQIRGLSHSTQTSRLRKPPKAVPWNGVRGDYETTSTPPAHSFYYPHLATSEYSRASEIDTDGPNSCLLEHRMNPSVFNTEGGKGEVQLPVADSSGGEDNEPSVVSFISGGTKCYRCRCGFESASKGRMDRHRDSLKHSDRKHRCRCGRRFTRDDSLKRHRKGCNN